jgi:hypothetical protein
MGAIITCAKAIEDGNMIAMPIEKTFRAIDLADEVYPHLTRYDTEGRVFNRGGATIARLLRKIKGVQEKPYGVFFAHKEYFEVQR